MTTYLPRICLAAFIACATILPLSPVMDAAQAQSKAKKASAKKTAKKKPAKKAPETPKAVSTAPATLGALQGDFNGLLNRTRSGAWGVMVVSLTRGDTVYAKNPGARIKPASTLKLFTSALALDRLGSEYQFRTQVLYDGTIKDGVLQGNLYLRGDGDPSLSPRFVSGDANTVPAFLADRIAAAGIKRITGNIIGDASVFDDQKIPDGWLSRYLEASYAARVSALSLNDNLVWVVIKPARSGQRAVVTLEPATTAIRVQSTAKTVAGSRDRIRLRKRSDGVIEVAGTIGSRAGEKRYSYVVDDPASFSAGALEAALAAKDIEVGGTLRTGTSPDGADLLQEITSPSLARLVSLMNRESLNLYAELLVRRATYGTDGKHRGSMSNANHTMRQLFQTFGTDTAQIFLADGSGLSPNSYITSRSMIQLLSSAHSAVWGPAFHASMPVAGVSALLSSRMKDSQAFANLHAKTGTTNEIVGLAGYVTAANGELLAFSFIYNGTDRWIARESIDAMGETLAAFRRP